MTYAGTIRGGVVVFNDDIKLPEGAEVRVEVDAAAASLTHSEAEKLKRQREALLDLARTCEQHLPTDASLNVDHYLYGMPKK